MKPLNSMMSYEEHKRQVFAARPNVKKLYDEAAAEYALIGILIEKRIKGEITQKELAKRLGTKQSAISRFESGNANPMIKFLYRLADALDVKLQFTVSA
ncbi:MAG: helix-turn-helix transcriptional regulator [Patescibacteria group bacterium]|jgi:ribosome-binding protein aMBF1 (putative translation factor)